MLAVVSFGFQKGENQRFHEIDVECINIIEKDGKVKVILTNMERFLSGSEKINYHPTNEYRMKRSVMLFFNEGEIVTGRHIYDGRKT